LVKKLSAAPSVPPRAGEGRPPNPRRGFPFPPDELRIRNPAGVGAAFLWDRGHGGPCLWSFQRFLAPPPGVAFDRDEFNPVAFPSFLAAFLPL